MEVYLFFEWPGHESTYIPNECSNEALSCVDNVGKEDSNISVKAEDKHEYDHGGLEDLRPRVEEEGVEPGIEVENGEVGKVGFSQVGGVLKKAKHNIEDVNIREHYQEVGEPAPKRSWE